MLIVECAIALQDLNYSLFKTDSIAYEASTVEGEGRRGFERAVRLIYLN